MGKRKLGALEKVDADLTNLRHKIRRDPKSYLEDFRSQYYQYENHREIFMAAPASATDTGVISLRDLIDFVAHVSDCYPDITKGFPNELMDILCLHHAALDAELRDKIVGCLVLLRKKDIIDSSTLLQTLFPILVSTSSKALRALLYQKILSDLRKSNSKTMNHKLNRTIQTALFNLVTADRASAKPLWAIKITRELWKRQIWTETKAVEIMKEAALADNEKVAVGGVRFFLGGDKEREEVEDESSDDDDGIDVGRVKHQLGVNKKNKKHTRAVEKATAAVKKKERKKKQPHPLNFSALHLLHDPQGFSEQLFSKHLHNAKSRLNLEQKLLVLQLVTRLVGLHKLTLIELYSYFLKFLTPRQPSVTSFLASLAQATHSLVPPDALQPLIQKIANEFVSEAAAAEVASAGLNAIREICVRQPLAMDDTLLQDLVMYRKSKDKGVMMAAKGLLSLYREVGAEMLRKRDRGKQATIGMKAGERQMQRYGEESPGEIEGLELLEKWKEEQKRNRRRERGLPSDRESEDEESEEDDDDADWAAWEVEGDDSDDSGGWIDVHSDQEIELSDSDDEAPSAKKPKVEDAGTRPSATDADEEDAAQESKEPSEDLSKKQSSLATSRILTPADLEKLAELRATSNVASQLPHNRSRQRKQETETTARHKDDPLTAAEIEGLAALSSGKATKEEKMARINEGKTDRSEFKSKTARKKEKKEKQGKSTTNKEKARNKNFMMTLGKAKSKNKRSLVETRAALRAHNERSKKGGRRGNW